MCPPRQKGCGLESQVLVVRMDYFTKLLRILVKRGDRLGAGAEHRGATYPATAAQVHTLEYNKQGQADIIPSLITGDRFSLQDSTGNV